MAIRNPNNDLKLLSDQYRRLADAVEGFYAGKPEQAMNIAVTLRLLMSEGSSRSNSISLLSRLNPNVWDLHIHDKQPLSEKTVFMLRCSVAIKGDGTTSYCRPEFDSQYTKVPLSKWWNGEYQPLGKLRLSKRDIIRTVSDKDGGAHLDETIPDHYITMTEPPFVFHMDNGGENFYMQPNMAYGITAQAGFEMLDFLKTHFSSL